jgi:membrane protein
MLDDDCFGLAGQLAFFSLLSLFPFLMFLVALAGLVISDPETVLRTLTERMQDVLPRNVVGLLVDYIDRTLRSATPSVLFLGVLAAFWSGWAAADALIKGSTEPTTCGRHDRCGSWQASPLRWFGGLPSS